ncbi:uncharacterized protein LOC110417214 [Herrania umbratica]|uniref:Uncharacterized protein LOC110417214 n=1 Tax=Herrania umbratica TaxID=108875 RepID=A0A6J1AE59_9ROSI|nr:uncharacterized protein LOC110417214 [Herrania umbratica]
MKNHESSDESVDERFPKHEHQSLGGKVDGNAIQRGLIDLTDFLLFVRQSVGEDELNDITRVNDGDVDAATRVGGDDVNVATRVGDDDMGATSGVGGDDVNAINQNDQSALGFRFGTFQYNNANIIARGTFEVTCSIQNNFGIDATLGATCNISSFKGASNVNHDASYLESVLNTNCNGSFSEGILDSTRNSSFSLRGTGHLVFGSVDAYGHLIVSKLDASSKDASAKLTFKETLLVA